MKTAFACIITSALTWPLPALAIDFTPGHYYSTSETAVNEYNARGRLLSSLAPGGSELRGLTFGPDGYLYVVRSDDPFSTASASVDVLRPDGTKVRSYDFAGSVWGNLSYGKITFDPTGASFYVGAGDGVYKFDLAGTTGSLFRADSAFDVEALPNGDILIASSYSLDRYSGAGTLLGSISTLADPNGLTGDPNPWLVDVRGVEFDAASNTTFVTMLGYSGFVDMSFKVLALTGGTNEIRGLTSYWYGDDMFVTSTGRLLIGSRTQAPAVFTPDLGLIGQFGGPEARFVTALQVPEPGSVALLLTGLAFGTVIRRKRSR